MSKECKKEGQGGRHILCLSSPSSLSSTLTVCPCHRSCHRRRRPAHHCGGDGGGAGGAGSGNNK